MTVERIPGSGVCVVVGRNRAHVVVHPRFEVVVLRRDAQVLGTEHVQHHKASATVQEWCNGGERHGGLNEVMQGQTDHHCVENTWLLRRSSRKGKLLGECADQIAEAAGGIPTVRCFSLEEAVKAAYEAAQPGDKVILAQACASWDMFASYKDRGKLFAECATDIRAQVEGDAQ